MSFIKLLFGENKSKDFQKTIPHISTKQLIIISLKIIGASVLSIVIGFIFVGILTGLNLIEPFSDSSEEGTIATFFIAGCTFLTAMLYFTRRYFYKDWTQIRKFYTSLPAKNCA